MIGEIGKAMKPTLMGKPTPRLTWNVVPSQSTHNIGGAIMGTDPATSALNKYQAELGGAERVRDGRHVVPAQFRLQPERPARCAGLPVGGDRSATGI